MRPAAATPAVFASVFLMFRDRIWPFDVVFWDWADVFFIATSLFYGHRLIRCMPNLSVLLAALDSLLGFVSQVILFVDKRMYSLRCAPLHSASCLSLGRVMCTRIVIKLCSTENWKQEHPAPRWLVSKKRNWLNRDRRRPRTLVNQSLLMWFSGIEQMYSS